MQNAPKTASERRKRQRKRHFPRIFITFGKNALSFLFLHRFLRFSVEERIFGRCADRNGKALTTPFEDAQTLGSKSGTEHHAGIYPMVGSRGTSRTDGYTHVYAHDGAWHTLWSVRTLRVATMTAIQAVGMFARTYYYYTLGTLDVVGIAEEELESVFGYRMWAKTSRCSNATSRVKTHRAIRTDRK